MTTDPTTLRYSDENTEAAVAADHAEESLVPDWRGGLTPAQQVENKLVALLKASPMPMSRLQKSVRPGR